MTTFAAFPEVSLSSQPSPLTGELCPGSVHFTCTALDLPSVRWFIDGSEIVRFTHNVRTTYPYLLNAPEIPGGFTVTIVSADASAGNLDNRDFVTTVDTTLATLLAVGVDEISCGSIMEIRAIPVSFSFRG